MSSGIAVSSEHYKLALAISMGGMLELYDFLIYAMMASYIAEHFFPASSEVSSLLGTFAAFAVGYLTRPLGGLFFGHLGDRYGRKRTFTLTIFLMALSTTLMGCLPTYDTIGIFAPVLLVILRLLQGFSLGGELPGAITYLSESIPERRGFMVGILYMAVMLGISAGTLIQGVLTDLLGIEAMKAFGWRIPFWIGGVLGVVSFQIRKHFSESGVFLALDQVRQRAAIPLYILFKEYRKSIVCALLLMALCGATATIYSVYMPSYLSTLLHFPRAEVAWHTAIVFLFLSPVCMLSGLVTDLMNKKMLVSLLAIVILVTAYPVFQYFSSEKADIQTMMVISGLLAAVASGMLPPMIVNLFPTEVRYTGIATGYNFGFAIFGGLAPFMSTLLVKYSGVTFGPALYLMIVAGLSLLAVLVTWPFYPINNPVQLQES